MSTAMGGLSALSLGRASAASTAHVTELYRSKAGQAEVLAHYDRMLDALPMPHASRMVETRFGPTHVLTIGPRDAPPLLALHGVHFSGPFMADIMKPFTDRYRVVIPDVVGQPGRSASTQPDPTGHNYAAWLLDVLDVLALPPMPVVGTSFGGAIALDLAAVAPARITRMALVVPGGFKTDSSVLWPLTFRLLLPWYAYRLLPDRARVPRTVHALAWEMTDDQYDYFDLILRHVNWLIPAPGPFTRDDLKDFLSPVLVYAAREDIFFPGAALVRAARASLPNLVDATLLESSHFPTHAAQAEIDRGIMAFLIAASPP